MNDLHTDHPDAVSSPGLALWRVTNAWQRRIRTALAPHDLTHVQYVLLASLTWMDRTEPVTQRDLARHAGLDVMMTSQVVRALEAKGFVVRERHPTDRRAVALEPTPSGTGLANRATRDVEAADHAYFAGMDPSIAEAFLTGLRGLAARVDDED
ncbi:MarR family winged helix-turn-helix transcriptional regulator [Curtobacterium sp. 22159]|uniref:MarR family winged helix-turn-helix transcriptional regulator n=1 Tax=Curtobacterium sp. 22159 TaxID=3453882 RepID=UPI003F825774